ncbi:MAG: heme exporter protein CcmD [Alphaproteobacteria bacterium]|nr:heme exporter protein CcmD [Alphaproteobacteria bacterium]
MNAFFDMGGYAAFVWPSYAVTAVGLVFLIATTLLRQRRARTTLARLEAERDAAGLGHGQR